MYPFLTGSKSKVCYSSIGQFQEVLLWKVKVILFLADGVWKGRSCRVTALPNMRLIPSYQHLFQRLHQRFNFSLWLQSIDKCVVSILWRLFFVRIFPIFDICKNKPLQVWHSTIFRPGKNFQLIVEKRFTHWPAKAELISKGPIFNSKSHSAVRQLSPLSHFSLFSFLFLSIQPTCPLCLSLIDFCKKQ